MFDSGIGGISVLRDIRELLPTGNLLYVADTAHVPYGSHSPAFIQRRAIAISNWLIANEARAIVVACNTATAAAVPMLRESLTVPVVGMEPAVKPAAAATQSGVVGVLATTGTLASARFAGLLSRFGDGIRVLTEPCPDLVESVERGRLNHAETAHQVREHLRPLLAGGADTVILGCTHFPLLKQLIEKEAGPDIRIIDTGRAVATQLERRLAENHLDLAGESPGSTQFFTTGDSGSMKHILARIYPGDWPVARLAELIEP